MARPIDISAVLNSLQALGQSNQRLAEIERQKRAKQSAFLGQLGGTAGSIAGGIYGGPVGAAAGGAAGSALGQRAGGGTPDASQVAASGAQGFQMGSAIQQSQNNQGFNTALSKNILSNPNVTPQQKQFAESLVDSRQDIRTSMFQAQSLGVDPQSIQRGAVNTTINTGTVDAGISALRTRQRQIGSEHDPEYRNLQVKIDRLEGLKSDNIGSLPAGFVESQVRREVPSNLEFIQQQGKVLLRESDPVSGQSRTISLGNAPQQGQKASPTLKTSAESAIGAIADHAERSESVTSEIRRDLAILNSLSNVPAENEAQAQKQIAAIQEKYTPESLRPTRETVYLDGKKREAIYDPRADTFRLGKRVVPASEVSLEKEESDDWRPQKVLMQKKEGGDFEPALVSYNPDNQKYRFDGKDVPSDRVKPIPTGRSRRIYDSQGNIIMEETSGGGLERPVRTEIQKEIAGNEVTLSSLEELSAMYNERFLQLPEQLQVGGLKVIEKAGFQLSPENQRRIEELSEFQAQTVDIAAKYIKQISGVAVSEAEARRLRKVLPQSGDSPSEFRAKMQSAMRRLGKINLIHKSILNGDIPVIAETGAGREADIAESGELYTNMRNIPPEAIEKMGDRLKRENNWTDAQVGAFLKRSGMF